MKKNIACGIGLPLFYFFINQVLRCCLYFDIGAWFDLLFFAVLTVLPCGTLVLLLSNNSYEAYFKALSTCFFISLAIFMAYMFSGLDAVIYTKLTGYEEMSLGDGFFTVLTMIYYFGSCTVGAVIALFVTSFKKFKRQRRKI